MATEETDIYDYWGRSSGLANWLMDRMDASWYDEEFFDQLSKIGLTKFTDFRSLNRNSFDSMINEMEWDRKGKNEFLQKFEQDFAKRFPNIYSSNQDAQTQQQQKGRSSGRTTRSNRTSRANRNKSTEKASSKKKDKNNTEMDNNDNNNSNNTSSTKTKSKAKSSKSSKSDKSKTKTKTKTKSKTKNKKSKTKTKTKNKNKRKEETSLEMEEEEDDDIDINNNNNNNNNNTDMKDDDSFEFNVNSDVLCFYQQDGRVYEGRILDRKMRDIDEFERVEEYLLHFKNWNSRWDKWVSASDIYDKTDENLKTMRELNGKKSKRPKISSN